MNRLQTNLIALLQKTFACGFMLMTTSAAMPLLVDMSNPNAIDLTTGVPAFQYLSAAAYVVTALMCLRHWHTLLKLLLRQFPLLLLIMLVWLSIGWSAYPEITARRAAGATGTMLFGLWLACRFTPREILRLIGYSLGMAAIASVVVALLAPHIGVHHGDAHAGYWRGVFIHKNVMGRWMCLGVLTLGWLWHLTPRPPAHLTLGLLACLLGLLASGSRTAWATTLLFAGIPLMVQYLRQHRTLLIGSATIIIPLAIISLVAAWHNLQDILALFGRDVTLSGRTTLWAMAWQAIIQKPILGYGFRVFWLQQNEIAWIIWTLIEWDPATAHNTFIDLTLDLGVIGLALFLASLIQAVIHAMRQLRSGDPLGAWHLSFLGFLFLQSLAETTILSPNTLLWALYVAIASAACSNARATASSQLPQAKPAATIRTAALPPRQALAR